jgi:threonine/homoserine/homoserine lactone efflux protein
MVVNPKELLQPNSLLKIFWGGFFTNALNPKVALFFLAFLPQFVATNSPHPSLSMLFLGLVFAVNGTIWNVGVAWSSSFLSSQLKASENLSLWLKRSCGALFVYFGIKLLRS